LVPWLAVIVAVLYVDTAFLVFRFRHPWATETQVVLSWRAALTFHSIPQHYLDPPD
jgi:hypothetical protein